ncbi:MAG: peptide-methionine (S)-S-oxide reductase MsrA [Pseudomonadota bacterium]
MQKLLLAALLAVPGLTMAQDSTEARAVFAGGCFWCVEEAFEAVDGVNEAISGYAGGTADTATYRKVISGRTGHAEVVEVRYDPAVVSYEELLEVFWLNIDPTTPDRQFCDRGSQYRSAIFPANAEQQAAAEQSVALLREQKPFDAPVVTLIEPLDAFYPAEAYHQNYYRTNALRYRSYKYGCGRPKRLEELWGDASEPYVRPE